MLILSGKPKREPLIRADAVPPIISEPVLNLLELDNLDHEVYSDASLPFDSEDEFNNLVADNLIAEKLGVDIDKVKFEF